MLLGQSCSGYRIDLIGQARIQSCLATHARWEAVNVPGGRGQIATNTRAPTLWLDEALSVGGYIELWLAGSGSCGEMRAI